MKSGKTCYTIHNIPSQLTTCLNHVRGRWPIAMDANSTTAGNLTSLSSGCCFNGTTVGRYITPVISEVEDWVVEIPFPLSLRFYDNIKQINLILVLPLIFHVLYNCTCVYCLTLKPVLHGLQT